MRERALSVHARVGSPASVRALLTSRTAVCHPFSSARIGTASSRPGSHGQRVRVRDYCHVPCAHGRFLLPDTARRKRGLAAVRRPRAIMSTLTTTHQVPPPSACAVPSPPSSPASSPSCRMHSTASSHGDCLFANASHDGTPPSVHRWAATRARLVNPRARTDAGDPTRA